MSEHYFAHLGGLIPLGDRFIPMPETEVQAIETALGSTIPHEYREFLIRYGAATFGEAVEFPFMERVPPKLGGNGRAPFGTFLGARSTQYGESNSLAWRFETYRERLPSNCLAIARDEIGNMVCIIVSGPQVGSIYYWEAGEELGQKEAVEQFGPELAQSRRFRNLYPIARSFRDFLFNLTVSSD